MLRAHLGWVRRVRARTLLLSVLVFVILGIVLVYHSGSQPASLNSDEYITARVASHSLRTIYDYPINAPHQLTEWAIQKLGFHGSQALRLGSALWMMGFALAFWRLAKSWFGRTVGLLGTLLFLGTPVLLVAGRQASADIMWLSPVLVMAAYNWLSRSQEHRASAWIALILSVGLSIYTPGMIWWLLAAAIITRQQLAALLGEVPRWLVGAGLLSLAIMLFPAGAAIFNDWRIIRDFGLVPVHWAPVLTSLKNIAWMLSALVYRTPFHSDLFIDRLPLLSVIQVGLALFGLYALWSAARNKTIVLAAALMLGVLAAGLNNQPSLLIICMPAIGVTTAAGLRYLFIEWRDIFPSNPIPKTLALVLMTALVATQLIYGVTNSIIAWPHTDATKTNYVLK